jgi:hypothetical protein
MNGEGAVLQIDEEDEIIKGTMVTRDGEIVHPALRNAEEEEADAPETEQVGD